MEETLRIGRVWALAIEALRANLATIILAALPIALVGSLSDVWLHAVLSTTTAQLLASLVSAVTGSIVATLTALMVVAHVEGRREPTASILTEAAFRVPGVVGTNILYRLGVGAAALLFIVPGIILGVRWMVGTQASAIERFGAQSALGRAGALGEGHRLIMFATGVITVALLFAPAILLGVGQAEYPGDPGVTAWIGAVLTAAATVLTSAVLAALYVELVRLKEGARPGYLAEVFA